MVLPRTRAGISVLDAIFLSYCLIVMAIVAIRWSALPAPASSLAIHLAVVAFVGIQAWSMRRFSANAAAIVWIVTGGPLITFLFMQLGKVVPYANPFHGERLLHRLDTALFLGWNPNGLLDHLAFPLLTEVLQIVYAGYYLLPLILLPALLWRRQVGRTLLCLTPILLGFLLSYLGYFVLPATGPNVNLHGLYPWPPYDEELRAGVSTLPGVLFADSIRAALYRAEAIRHDCFPSGHVAVSLVVLVLARRHHRQVFWILLAPVLLLVLATMYLRYHYVVDVIAGMGLTWLTIRLAPRVDSAYARWIARRNEVSSGGEAGKGR